MVEVPLECDGGLEHFEVTVDKDTVEYGTTASLRVQAKDGEGNDVELDDGELIRMMLRPAVIAGSVKGGSDLKGEMASFKVEGSSGGGMYGSFIVEGSEAVADEVEVGYGVVRQGKVRYLADGGVPSGPEPEEVMIVAELVEDETKNGWTVVVVRKLAPPLDHFVVRVNPDTVEHGKSAVITVIAQDASNNEVTIEGNTPLTFTVDKPEYGSIDPASGMTYGVARAGGVRYLANGTNPLTPQRVAITVTGAGKSGSGSVVVKKKGCEGPPCPPQMDPPAMSFTEVGREYPKLASDPCASPQAQTSGGLFRTLTESEEPVVAFSPETCFDPATNVWKFSVASLSLRVSLVISQQELEARGFRVIQSVNQIPDAEACDALIDIANHYGYPVGARSGGFILRPVLFAHEQVHRQQFERHLSTARKIGAFDQSITELTLPCEQASSVEDARQQGRQQIERLANDLLKRASSLMAEERRTMGNDRFEQMTQGDEAVTRIVREAFTRLDERCSF